MKSKRQRGEGPGEPILGHTGYCECLYSKRNGKQLSSVEEGGKLYELINKKQRIQFAKAWKNLKSSVVQIPLKR